MNFSRERMGLVYGLSSPMRLVQLRRPGSADTRSHAAGAGGLYVRQRQPPCDDDGRGQPQVTYTYDNANRLTAITQSTSTVTIAYDDADRRTSVTYPNTNKAEYAYNAASELTTVTYKQGTTTLGTLTYTYDGAGNRLQTGGTFARTNIPPGVNLGQLQRQ